MRHHACLSPVDLTIPKKTTNHYFFHVNDSDVEEAFQLEIEVTGTPVATKFGTMAGFSNTQTVSLGHLHLPLPLEPLEKSIRTYKLRRSVNVNNTGDATTAAAMVKAQSKEKVDCEIVVMIGVHVLEEPVDDQSWESDVLFEGHLTVMTGGLRMAVSILLPAEDCRALS